MPDWTESVLVLIARATEFGNVAARDYDRDVRMIGARIVVNNGVMTAVGCLCGAAVALGRKMVRLGTLCVLLTFFSAANCNGESGAVQRSPGSTSQSVSALLVLPGAANVKTAKRYDGEVSYTLEEAWPAEKALAFVERELAAEGWQPSKSYLLSSGNPDADPSLRVWRNAIVGQQTVFSWWGQWSKSDGSVVLYVLQYKVLGGSDKGPAGPLNVDALFFSAATADALRKGI